MTGPDFLIVGAMKSGTTTLQAQLVAQPQIFMTTPKEPNYFSDDAVYAQGPDWYAGLYADASPEALKGEASTHYTKLPTYPHTVSRLAAAVPDPRLIYVIRNPVDRAISHFIHEWSQGQMRGDMTEAFAQHSDLVDFSRYGMQITPFLQQFGPGSVYLTSLEQLKTDPDGELSRIGAHIRAPEPLVWNHTQQAQNVSAARVRKFPLHGLLVDNPVAAMLRRALVPKALRTRIREARMMRDRPQMPDKLRAELEQVFAEDRATLMAHFPSHPALTACYPFCQT